MSTFHSSASTKPQTNTEIDKNNISKKDKENNFHVMGPKAGVVIKWSNPPPNPTSHWFLKRTNSTSSNKSGAPLN
jgi:hypothetical protein